MRFLVTTIFILVSFFYCGSSSAQERARIIQFSGIVLGQDSTSGVPGVHIYAPKAGRGTTTNAYGYFSMPVLEGDSLIISAVSYERRHFIIPKGKSENYTVVIELTEDTTYLPELQIFP